MLLVGPPKPDRSKGRGETRSSLSTTSMSEMSRMNISNNGVNGTRTSSDGVAPGRCTTLQQGGLGRHQATACEQTNGRMKWKKEINRFTTKGMPSGNIKDYT